MRNRMQLLILILFALCLVTFVTPFAHAQFFEVCRTGSVRELIENIKAHSEHIYRLNYKFDHIRYLQTPQLPPGVEPARLNDVLGFLDELSRAAVPRKAAVLFYAYCQGKLCTWLMPPSRSRLQSHVADMSDKDFQSLRPILIKTLRARGKVNERLPTRRGVEQVDESPSDTSLEAVLERTRRYVLPDPILEALLREKTDTLVVVPISNIGTIPFGAFRVGDKALVDIMSVVVAPSFLAFKDKPERAQRDLSNPIIVGDPQGWSDPTWDFPPLPGARAEAEEVAKSLQSRALTCMEGSKKNIEEKLHAQSRTGLIFLSTHGVAD